MRRVLCCALLALASDGARGVLHAAGDQEAVARAWDALDAAPANASAAFEARRDALEAAGPAADVALQGLVTFAAADARGRRERSRFARADGDARGIALALEALGDADDVVRADLTAYLGERRLLDAQAGERVEALSARALDDPAADVRTAALAGLAAIDDPRALLRLERLLDELAGPDRAEAARLLAEHAGARERLVRRVQETFTGAVARPLAGEALARLLGAYGDALMHLPGGGATAAERLPLVAGRVHPDGLVRLAAGSALDALVQGLAVQADVARADALLVALGEDGIPAREIAYRRASLALTSAADLAPAVAGAAAILFDTEGSDERADREWRVRGALLGAAAEIAAVTTERTAEDAEHLARGRAHLALARRTLAGLLAERIELLSSPARRARGNDEDRATYAHLDCLVDLWLAAAELAAGGTPADAQLLSALRSMHVRQIAAQAVAAESGARNDLGGFQPLLDDPLGPLRLAWSNKESRAWPPDRALGAWADLGRAIAGVSAAEMPGFEPASSLPAMRDPLADPERKRLLAEVLQASFDGVLSERSAEGDRARPDEDKLDRLLLNFRIIASDLRRLSEGDEAVLRRTRTPSNLALDLTVRYLEDGDAAEARALAERMKADLFKAGEAGGAGGAGVSEPLVARLEAAVGSAYMDESDPENAERSFRQAASRLEAYEQGLQATVAAEAGDPELRRSIDFALASVRSQRADCLLSLAVNANVKKNDQEAALAWFEQAYELKQNDFMRVLLACYRARSGRAAEARAVLREVAPVPSLYYNLACTHALLGDLDLAADYLGRELGENHATERSRARQRQWARGDPDLKALRGHPRFERLVGP